MTQLQVQLLTLTFLLFTFHQTSCKGLSNESKLLKDILQDYQKFARPVLNNTNAINVTFGFELIQIISISEGDQTITMKIWMRMSWTNELLRWDKNQYGDIAVSKLDRETVWTPDIYQLEDTTEDMSSGPTRYDTPITIQHNGKHTWFIPVLITSSCIIDVKHFPFDEQTCKLKFVSWTHDQTELDIHPDPRPVVTSNYINSTAWDLMGVEHSVQVVRYLCCPNPYVDIHYILTLHRKPQYYVFNVVIPCILQMLIILFTFFLPPDSGERIGVVITVILVFAVYLEVVSNSLPKTSTSKPTLSFFYITAMTESAVSLIATCFVLVIHFKGAEKGVPPMPAWIRHIFIDNIAKYVWVRINLREYSNEGLLALKLQKEAKKGAKNGVKNGVINGVKNGAINGINGADIKSKDHIPLIPDSTITKLTNGIYETEPFITMDTLITEVRVITKLIHDQNRQDEIEEEWQILAKVFDRMFFIIFFVIFSLSTVLILIPVYLAQKNLALHRH